MKELKKSLYQKLSPDKETIGGLLKDELYRIPKYQRGFAWEENNVLDFWDDINKQIESDEDIGHFFGILILAETTETRDDYYEALEVVDGQQRLVTFIILLRVLHDVLEKGNEDYQLVQNIKDRIRVTGHAPRLKVGDRDSAFYTNWFAKFDSRAKTRLGKTKSEKYMRQAYEIFREKIKEKAQASEKSESNVARELWAVIDGSKKLFVLKIIVPTEADAFTIFETINAKRAELTASELIKNSVFGYAQKLKILDIADENWEIMLDRLSGTADSSSVEPTEYIRHLYISVTGSLIREKELYRKIRDTYLREENTLSEFLHRLADEAENYSNIVNNSREIDLNDITVSLSVLKTLNDMNYKQIRPLLLSLLRKFTSQEVFDEAIKYVEAYAIRASLAKVSPSRVENTFASLAKAVHDDPSSGIEQIKVELTKSAPSDDIIRSNVIHEDARIAKVILKSMERDEAEPDAKDDKMLKAQLEHILPQNPEGGSLGSYGGMDRDTHAVFLNRFGNLTLLGGYNPRLSNKPYEIKIEKYKISDFFITQSIPNKYDRWGAKQIKQRSEEIADYVLKKWKL